MKRLLIFMLIAALSSSPTKSQPNAQAEKQQPPNSHDYLENDPGFKRLSPETQEWLRGLWKALDKAVQERDVKGIAKVRLELAHYQLIGKSPCGHVVGEGTFVDARATSATKEEAIAIRWLDPEPGTVVHSAILTGNLRCVVVDGDTIEGKLIGRALPNSLGISNQHGFVAWEGEYWNSGAEKASRRAPHRGAFMENRFLYELDPRKASPLDSLIVLDKDQDFHWMPEDERLVPKPGILAPGATSLIRKQLRKEAAKSATPPK